jgi:regulator of cell morphogenesis and NO signaling
MKITEKSNIGELVAENYRTAEAFAKHQIDFCCKGNETLEQVCEKKKIVVNNLIAELETAVKTAGTTAPEYHSWPLDLLADYIEKKHHRYVVEKTPVIQQYLAKVCQVHGKAHPELLEIAGEFNECAAAFAAHMKKEELILFPFIRKMVQPGNTTFSLPGGKSVESPISVMKHEHDMEGERFRRISGLSSQYTPPADACNTYKVTYSLLKEFEQDLHLHIHLENNILFPKALSMESSRRATSCAI